MNILWPTKDSINEAKEFLRDQRGFGFFDGGCLIFAQAITHITQIKSRVQIATLLIKNKPDHYGLIVDSELWADARGIHQNKFLWAQNYTIQEKISGRAEVIDHYVPSENIPSDLDLSNKVSEMLILTEQQLNLGKKGKSMNYEKEI